MESYLKVTDANLLKAIEKDLNEDPERLARQIQLFKEWLRCEPHLPKEIDEHLIFNFVRFCKCNLDKAKKKFENYLAARIKWRQSYSDRVFDEKYFAVCNIHRQFVIHPKLTPDGYRVCFYRIPPIDEFDFDQLLHYGIALVEMTFFENTSSGCVLCYDFENCTPQHLSRFNITALLTFYNLTHNILPLRIHSIHIFNTYQLQTIINIVLKILNEKITKRVKIHKHIEELLNCLPSDNIFEEYGGMGGSLIEYADKMKEFLLNNDDLAKKCAALKLIGPIPSDKVKIYSFEECEMKGSFRKLNID